MTLFSAGIGDFLLAQISPLRRLFSDFARRTPCGVMACGVLCVLLPLVFFPEGKIFSSFLPAFFLLLAGSIFSLSVAVWKFAFPGLLVWASFLFWQAKIENDPVKEFAANRERVGIVAVLRADSSSLFGDESLLQNPKRIPCKLLMGAYSAGEKMHEINGKVILRIPVGFSETLSYGDILHVTGQLIKPSAPLLEGSFDYRMYLKKRSIHYILHADKIEKRGREYSFTAFLLDFRKKFSQKVFSLLPEKNRSFAAALLFGCAQNVEKETKSDLIRTGTIHILTVSGLHIGFFAAFTAILFILLPFQTRMFLIPLLTFLYAWMTGLNMPALRALLMLSAYCFAKGCFLNSSARNSLFFAFVLLMIFYPLQITDAGMHYSFITTFSLLLAAENIMEWGKLLREKYSFIPSGYISWKEREIQHRKILFFRIFAGCCAAWGGSSCLTMLYQGIAAPCSVIINFIFIPIVWLCFPVFFLGSLISHLFFFGEEVSACILKVLTDLLLGICRVAAGSSDFILPRPGVWAVTGFLLLFFLFLQEKKRGTVMLTAFAGILAVFLLFTGNLFPEKGELICISGGGSKNVCIVVSIPEYQYAFLMDAVDFEKVMGAAAYLRSRGHRKINTLVSSSVQKKNIASLQYIFNILKVDRLIMPGSSRHAVTAESLRRKVVRENGECMTFEKENDHFSSFRQHENKIREISIDCFSAKINLVIGTDRVELYRINDRREKTQVTSFALKNSLEEKIYTFPL